MIASKEWVLSLLNKSFKRKAEQETDYIDLQAIWMQGAGFPGIATGLLIDSIANPIFKWQMELHGYTRYNSIGPHAYTDESHDCFRVIMNSGNYLGYCFQKAGGGGVTINPGIVTYQLVDYELGRGYFIVNGNKSTFSTAASGTHANSPIGVFDSNGAENDLLYGKVEIYDGTTLLRQYLPKKRRSDGAVGFLETVTNTFYTNTGKGMFKGIM